MNSPAPSIRPDDCDELAALCTPDVRALYVIHYLGWPQPIAALAAFCRERGLPMIEDCALALLSRTANRPLGTFGDYSVFCLYKSLPVPNGMRLRQIECPGPLNGRVHNEMLELPGHAAMFAEIIA